MWYATVVSLVTAWTRQKQTPPPAPFSWKCFPSPGREGEIHPLQVYRGLAPHPGRGQEEHCPSPCSPQHDCLSLPGQGHLSFSPSAALGSEKTEHTLGSRTLLPLCLRGNKLRLLRGQQRNDCFPPAWAGKEICFWLYAATGPFALSEASSRQQSTGGELQRTRQGSHAVSGVRGAKWYEVARHA